MIGCDHLITLRNPDSGLADVGKVVPEVIMEKMRKVTKNGQELALPGNYFNIGNTTVRYEAGPRVQACNATI